MASWAAILALSGFQYSAVDQRICFAAPTEARRHFWSTGYAWGSCTLSPNGAGCDVEFTVLGGEVTFAELALTGLGAARFDQLQALTKGDTLSCKVDA